MTYDDLPSRFEPDPERAQRIKRGVAACRAVLAEMPARTEPDDDLTDPVRRARDRAAIDKRARRRGDPAAVKDVLPEIRRRLR